MATNFELRFSGLVLFSFVDDARTRCQALVIKSEGCVSHRPAFAYRIRHLKCDKKVNPRCRVLDWPHEMFAPPVRGIFASSLLDHEVLQLKVFRDGDPETPSSPGVTTHESFDRLVVSLSNIEPGIPSPSEHGPQSGIQPTALTKGLPPSAPIVARLEFDAGTLSAGPPTSKAFVFREENGMPVGGGSRSIAQNVLLTIKDANRVELHSDRRREPLVFGGDLVKLAQTSLTNEPADFGQDHNDRLDHFAMFYNTMQWRDDDPARQRRPIPFVASGGQVSINDDLCPNARE